jgi:hypothetical protein
MDTPNVLNDSLAVCRDSDMYIKILNGHITI